MKKLIAFVGVSLAFFSYTQAGGGFELSLNGYRYLGMGYTGTGLAFDSYSVYLNPGALGFIKRNYIQLGASFVKPSTTFLAQNPNSQGFAAETENMDSVLITPFSLFGAWRKEGSRLTFGIGVNNPFAYNTRWDENWKGKSIVQESSLSSIYILPTVSYRINDQFGIGGGLIYGLGNFLIRKSIPRSGKNNTQSWVEQSGSGRGLGYNLGLYYKPSDRLALGVNFRSNLSLDMDEGKINFSVPPSQRSEFEKDSVFTTEIDLPGALNVGMSYQLRNDLVVAMDINYTFWQVYDVINIEFRSPDTRISNVDNEIVRNFENAFSVRMGVEYAINRNSFIRFGAIYNKSPVQDTFVSPEFPDTDHIGLTAGYGILLFNHFQIDVAYKFEYSPETFGELASKNFSGLYETITNVLGVGVSYVF